LQAKLPRVLALRRQARTLLALPVPVVSVGVLRGQFMAPFAVCFTPVGRDERSAARPVFHGAGGFPVGRILACAVRAVVPSMAVRTAVMADVIDGLARLKRTHELGEAVSVCVTRTSSPSVEPVIELPVPVLVKGGGPGPAVVGTSPVDVREIPVETRHVETAQRPAQYAGSPQLGVMSPAEPLRPHPPVTFTAIRHITSLVQMRSSSHREGVNT
jgi:hypothetical protein